MVDQVDTFTNRILVDAAEALTALEQLREQIDNYKQSIKTVAQQTNESFAAVAESIKRATAEAKRAALDNLAKVGPPQGLTINEAQAQITKEYAINLKALNTAIKELNLEQKNAAQSAKQFGGDASAAAQAYRQQIDQLKASLIQISQQQKVSLKDAAQGLIQSGQRATKEVNQALRELTQTSGATSKGLSSLGTVAQFVFGAVLGITAISVIRNLIGWLQKAAEAGLEFARAVFQIEVGVRALQRAGVDITIKEVYQNLDRLREKFKIFTTKELVVGSAAFLNLIRDMGFTKDEIFELQDAITTLAVVNGRAMDEVQKTVALALSSGYTEGLQRLGVSINRVTIAEKAAELGWKGGYTSLTELQRAEATRILILEKTAIYQEDLAEYYKTLPGQIDVTTKAIEEQKNTIGSLLTPLTLLVRKIEQFAVSWFALFSPLVMAGRLFGMVSRSIQYAGDVIQLFNPGLGDLVKRLQSIPSPIKVADDAFRNFATSVGDQIQEIAEKSETLAKWLELIKQYYLDLKAIASGKPLGSLGDTEVSEIDQAEQNKEFVEAMIEEINDAEDEFQKDSLNAWKDYQDDLAKINRTGIRRQVELWRDYARDLAKIDRDLQADIGKEERKLAFDLEGIDTKEARAVEDAYRDYNRDLADIDRDTAERKAKAEREYRQREINEEAKFQEKMRQMREDFLMDLEDAVRERDARQIMRLIRTYNKERDQATREHELDKKQRGQDFADELADIERQRQIRKQERAIELQEKLQDIAISATRERQERAIEHQERLNEIRLQAEQERQERALKYKQDQEELQIDLAQRRADRLTDYKQELLDLKAAQAEKLIEVANGLAEEYGVTAEGLESIRQLFEAYYGPEGIYTEIIKAFYATLGGFLGGLSVPDPSKFGSSIPKSGTNTIPKFAKGGTLLATKPTAAIFGEESPELVTFTPLDKIGKNVGQVMGGQAGFGGSGEKITVELLLSPDLEVRVINKTLGVTADVLKKTLGQKVQRGI